MTTVTEEKTAEPGKANGGDKPASVVRKALGRGLESLLPGTPRVVASAATGAVPGNGAAPAPVIGGAIPGQGPRPSPDAVLQVAVELIDRNPYQTRTLDQESTGGTLQELAESIRANGVIQPITVRPAKDGRYVLITGERRWRASKLAGKQTVPVIVKHCSDQQAAEMTVVENLQRQDLNCIEQAAAFAKLSREFGMTQEQIGQRVGVSRETVSNYMRLLKLPESVRQYLADGKLGFSEARVLLTVINPEMVPKLADEAVKKHLSVVQLEELVAHANLPLPNNQEQQGSARWVDPNVRA